MFVKLMMIFNQGSLKAAPLVLYLECLFRIVAHMDLNEKWKHCSSSCAVTYITSMFEQLVLWLCCNEWIHWGLLLRNSHRFIHYLSIYPIYIALLHRFMIVSEVLYNIHLSKACQYFNPVWGGSHPSQINSMGSIQHIVSAFALSYIHTIQYTYNTT